MTQPCDTCAGELPAVTQLQSKRIRIAGGRATPVDSPGWTRAMCGRCVGWLATVLTDLRLGTGAGGHIAAPQPSVPAETDTECHLCHQEPGDTAAIVEGRRIGAGGGDWPALLLCPPCDGWVGSLAASSSTILGREERAIDGPYGRWPHPNLRHLRVTLDCDRESTAATLVEACGAMGIAALFLSNPVGGAVHICDASRAARALAAQPSGMLIAVAPYSGEAAVRDAIEGGAREWITEPPTPQQITAALVRAARPGPSRVNDPSTCLPRIVAPQGLPPALSITPRPGVTTFQAAWLVRRFARGYDEVGTRAGEIIMLPRAAPEQIGDVARRLEGLLRGSCEVAVLPDGTGRVPRIDTAA